MIKYIVQKLNIADTGKLRVEVNKNLKVLSQLYHNKLIEIKIVLIGHY